MLLALYSGVDILDFLMTLPILIPVLLPILILHEISHGLVAHWLGDDTAKSLGRLSLNPLSHLDRAGTIMFLLIGIGYAKPVPVNPYRLNITPRKGMAIIAAAGPLTNLLIAAIFSIPFRLNWLNGDDPLSSSNIIAIFVALIILYNLILTIFNLIPIPPFDGFRILVGILPKHWANPVAKTEQYSQYIFIVLLILIFFTPVISLIIENGVDFFSKLLMGGELF